MNIKSLKLFSFSEKVITIYGILLNNLLKKIPKFTELLSEKGHFDRILDLGYELIKINNSVYRIIYRDRDIGELKINIRRKSSDYLVFNQVIENKSYLPIIDILKEKLATVNTVIDVGGNIGLATLFFSKYYPSANIYTIEPDQQNFEMLKSNLKINNIRANIYNRALWSENTELSVKNNFRDGQSWALQVSPISDNNSDKVKTITLSELLESNKIKTIDILKIDIEGAEFELFTNELFMSILKKNVEMIAIEIHEEMGDKGFILDSLKLYGFKVALYGETWIGLKL